MFRSYIFWPTFNTFSLSYKVSFSMKQSPLAHAAIANSIRNCALMVFLGWNLISKVSTFVAMQPLPILFQQLGLQFAKVLCFSKKSRYSGSTLNRSFSASGQVSTLRSAFSSHLILIGLQMQNTWRWRNWLVWLVAASKKKNTRSIKTRIFILSFFSSSGPPLWKLFSSLCLFLSALISWLSILR